MGDDVKKLENYGELPKKSFEEFKKLLISNRCVQIPSRERKTFSNDITQS